MPARSTQTVSSPTRMRCPFDTRPKLIRGSGRGGGVRAEGAQWGHGARC